MEKRKMPEWHKDPKYVRYSYYVILATLGTYVFSLFVGLTVESIFLVNIALVARFALTGVYVAGIYCTFMFARAHGKSNWWIVPIFLFPLIAIPIVYFNVKKQIR